ncbi:hypothetical protein [Niallia sp. MER TA 168]|uniref:hypothetical protein n=1 Tax=Niallia sp. MER TA 168 TaxID=2939568 RepID=UPI00203FE522|nr:hypothetical protein [Niallia sp. MER TA 168]MCM3362252.1 hypothetical protein [Niallia sp. MER TA 168]
MSKMVKEKMTKVEKASADELLTMKEELKVDLKKLEEKEKELNQQSEGLRKSLRKYEEKRAKLAERQQEIESRELNAELGFTKEREASSILFEKQKAEITANYQRYHAELQKKHDAKRKEIDKLLEQMDAEVSEKRKKLEQDISKQRTAKLSELEKEYDANKRELNQRLAKYKKDMEDIVSQKEAALDELSQQLVKKRQQLEKDRKAIAAERESLNTLHADLKVREENVKFELSILEKDRELFNEKVQLEIQSRLEEKDRNLDQLKENQQRLIVRIQSLQNELAAKEEIELRSGSRTPADLLNEIDILRDQMNSLKKELQSRPTQAVLIELEEKARKFDELLETQRELQKRVAKYEQSEHLYFMSVSRLQQEQEKYEIEVKRREAIEAQIEKYVLEVERLKALHEQPKEIEARRGVIEEPEFERQPLMRTNQIDEIKWLDFIVDQAEKSGLKFNRRLFYAFHTALKTADYSPLTVLAGVSGTGKSELPRLYSRFGGLYYLSLAVQPDWDSPQSLFGYFNSVDNRFNATSLLRAMVQFQDATNERTKEASLNDSVLLVLLDEMNLAHVELYFSELLSKLETRRGESDPVYTEIDLGAGMKKYKVELSKNVLWVGTMNEDETTKSLSDKVIDRGNLISFPRPTKFERRLQPKLEKESPKLPRKIWDSWLNDRVELDEIIDTYKEALEDMNACLEKVGRALGHRVWQSVENYIANHPLVIHAKKENNQEALDNYIRRAFEEALVHKVMPKLRGIEVDSGIARSECLDPIALKIREYAPGLYQDFQLAMQNAYRVFIWRSAKYLEEEEV